jgi:NAD(P)-dependent dehydrogenase (short-subunit alcohol dehydrogenase family)
MNQLTGKTAVITGGSSGIGLATALLFRDEGARVVVAGRDQAALDRATALLGANALGVPCDVGKPDDIKRLMDRAAEWTGGIDIVFANAGMSECPDIFDTPEGFFDTLMDTNVKGVFYTFVHAFPHLREGASVVLTSSVAHSRGRPGDPLYSATKAAVRSLARTLAADDRTLAKRVRVNTMSPGAIRTPLTAAATDDAAVSEWVAGQVPMGRWGEAEEVARGVLFLACSASSYMTGGEIAVDGGLGQI